MTSAMNCRVGVLGATSFIGVALLPLLVGKGWQVSAFSRHAPKHVRQSNVSWVVLEEYPISSDSIPLWICLAPIWVLPFYFDQFVECRARHIVAVSSTSRFTKTDSTDPAEQALAQKFANSEDQLAAWAQSHGAAWTVLRPTLIYGLGQDKNVSQIARLIRIFNFFPLFGEARGLRQPIHLQDLAAACVAALERPQAHNRAFNLSGAEVLSYREMVSRVFDALGKRPRFVRAPLWMFRLVVTLMQVLPRYRNWSAAMAERMNRDMVFDHSEAARELGFSPRAFVLKREDLPS